MKIILLSLACLFKSILIQSQSTASDYAPILKTVFDAFDSTNNYSQKVALSNKLSLIAVKWNDVWVTHYYVGYSKAILSSLEKEDDKRDDYLDEAEKEHDKAIVIIGKENEETYVLAALISNWRIAISPMMRSGKYAKIFRENLSKAQELNPRNPRIYYLQGAAKFAMPKFVGGGKETAMPYLLKADSLFAQESSANINKPYWGKSKNTYYLAQCKIN
jgi:hypothetical protein